MKLRTVCRLAGIFSLASLLLYAFAGVAIWSQVPPVGQDGAIRSLFLFMAHFGGLFAGVLSLDDFVWKDK